MIYVTGDTHGIIDLDKLTSSEWPEGMNLTRDDYVIVCGDFGAVWSGGLRDKPALMWWESRPWTTLWVDGNHENHDLIDSFEVSERFGGRVQVVPGYEHVVHLMRGEVYDLPVAQDKTVRAFVMGGAYSIDKVWRVEGTSWWAREEPSQQEYENATANLERVGFQVDYVFTHEVTKRALVDALGWNYGAYRRDPSSYELPGFLWWVDDQLDKDRLRMWYAGHHHVDRMVLDDKHCVLYQQVVPLGSGPHAAG